MTRIAYSKGLIDSKPIFSMNKLSLFIKNTIQPSSLFADLTNVTVKRMYGYKREQKNTDH